MATGWAGDGAVQDQIDATVEDASSARAASCRRARASSTARNATRRFPKRGARPCRACACAWPARKRATENGAFSGYNRRGSKDSQLR